jgi:hypothetical protein
MDKPWYALNQKNKQELQISDKLIFRCNIGLIGRKLSGMF